MRRQWLLLLRLLPAHLLIVLLRFLLLPLLLLLLLQQGAVELMSLRPVHILHCSVCAAQLVLLLLLLLLLVVVYPPAVLALVHRWVGLECREREGVALAVACRETQTMPYCSLHGSTSQASVRFVPFHLIL